MDWTYPHGYDQIIIPLVVVKTHQPRPAVYTGPDHDGADDVKNPYLGDLGSESLAHGRVVQNGWRRGFRGLPSRGRERSLETQNMESKSEAPWVRVESKGTGDGVSRGFRHSSALESHGGWTSRATDRLGDISVSTVTVCAKVATGETCCWPAILCLCRQSQ